MKWIEVKIKTTHEAVEIISNILHESGVGGVVIEDPQDFKAYQSELGVWDYIDESLINNLGDVVCIKGYLSESPDLPDKIQLIKERVDQIDELYIDAGLKEITTTEVYEEDWSTAWKQYYKPIQIGKNIVIKPTWEPYEGREGQKVIELDPGMAFGTGTHETTQLCIAFLEDYVRRHSLVLDIGTGSGILAIIAAKLGSDQVIGVDIDPIAVKVARENVALNGVEDLVEIREGDLLDVVKEKADIVVANIIADTIIHLMEQIKNFLKKDGIFIASGIILDRQEDVKRACHKEGLRILSIDTMGEWVAICCMP